MFAMSRRDLKPAYTCGSYHARGLKGCTSHHTRVDVLDELLKSYVEKVRDNSADMLDKLNESLKNEQEVIKENTTSLELLQNQIDDTRQEMKILVRQQAKELLRNPDRETAIDEMYREMLVELADRIDGLTHQLELTSDRRNTIIRVNRIAKTALDIFEDILNKEKLDKTDLQLIIEKITVFDDRIEIQLKADIDAILKTGEIPVMEEAVNFNLGTESIEKYSSGGSPVENRIIQKSKNHLDKVLSVRVVCEGDPLEIYTDSDGEVIFKKYSPIGEITAVTDRYAEVLYKGASLPVIITDRDMAVACAGLPHKEVLERRVTSALESIMEHRSGWNAGPDSEPLRPLEGLDRFGSIAYPIIGAGDVLGAVVLLMGEDGTQPTQAETKLVQVAAAFLGKQMEE